jgi:hypothetical protein
MDTNISNVNLETTRFAGVEASVGSLDMMLNPSYMIEVIRHSLLGERFDPRQAIWIPIPEAQPKMSREGVEDIMRELETIYGIPNIMGALEEREYYHLLEESFESIRVIMFMKNTQYGINDADLKSIKNTIKHNVTLLLSRSRRGFMANMISKVFGSKEQVVKHENQTADQATKSSGLSLFGRSGK